MLKATPPTNKISPKKPKKKPTIRIRKKQNIYFCVLNQKTTYFF